MTFFKQAKSLREKEGVPLEQLQSTIQAIEVTSKKMERQKDLAQIYDQVAKEYDQKVLRTKYVGPEWLIDNLSSFAKSQAESFLDLVCGNGINVRNLKKFNPQIKAIGVDISHEMIKEANRKKIYTKAFVKSLEGGFDYLKESTFDLVFGMGCLEFVLNIKTCLDRISERMKPSAEFYGTFQAYDEKDKNSSRVTYSGSVPHHAYTKSEIINMFERRNFKVQKTERLVGYVGQFECPYFMFIVKK